MARPRRGIGTTVAVVVVIVVLAVATIAFVTLSKSSTSTTPSTSSASSSNTSSTPGTASTSNSSDGLEFSLQIVPSGNGTFAITAEEVNLLNSVNSVTQGNGWKYPTDQLDPFNNCAPGVSPVGFAVFQGYYGMNNYTSGEALPLYDTATLVSCTVNYFPNMYLFQPKSDNVSVYNDHQFRINTTASVSASVSGYWTGGEGLASQATFNAFVGSYTVLGADGWGDVLLLHFSVATSSSTSVGSSTAPIECPRVQSSVSGVVELTAGTSSPAVLCFQLYYYSATPLTINLTSALSIQALQYVYNGSAGTPRSFSGGPNFTVSASQSQLVVGGNTNENEGTVVAFQVTAKAGASGTYQLGFLSSPGLGGGAWMLGSQEPLRCGYYGQLEAGSGQPDYNQGIDSCITYTTASTTTTCLCPTAPAACPCASETTTSTSSSPSLPGIPYALMDGSVYFRIVGVTNSTG
jgi:hypothetical protein